MTNAGTIMWPIYTDRLALRLLKPEDAALALQYYEENQIHLDPWEPVRCPNFLTLEHWTRQIRVNHAEYQTCRSVRTAVFWKNNPDRIIGMANLNNIILGPLRAGVLGYSLAEDAQGAGVMREAVTAIIDFAFHSLNLFRVTANYIPRNHRSEKLLLGLGFEKEGYARKYLEINGVREDHILTAMIRPDQILDEKVKGGDAT